MSNRVNITKMKYTIKKLGTRKRRNKFIGSKEKVKLLKKIFIFL